MFIDFAGKPGDYLVVEDANWMTFGIEHMYVVPRPLLSGYCRLCGQYRGRLHKDHIIPRFKGGGNNPKNIQLICANCHQDKTANEAKEAVKLRAPLTEEAKRKLGRALIGRANPGVSAKLRGRTQSAEANAKRSATLKGRTFAAETCEKISQALQGHKVSEGSREKMRQAQLRIQNAKRGGAG
ncbi:MAG TPA: HNH endonuclease signature motif containing protein [Candidatus Paceibacterota bacterium]